MTRGFVVAVLMVFGAFTPTSVAADVWPDKTWPRATPAELGLNEALLCQARDYALRGGGSGCVIRHGKLVFSWGDLHKLYDLKSTTKSFGATALGLAIADGKLGLSTRLIDVFSRAGEPLELNAPRSWQEEITLFHLATHTAGFEKPGGSNRLLFRPGKKWHYSDSGPNWLADCITLTYKKDLKEFMFRRLFRPIGISEKDLTWRRNQYRPHLLQGIERREFGSGIKANVRALARLGYLYLRRGRWRNEQLLPTEFVKLASCAQTSVVGIPELDPATYDNASDHYGLLWWNNADGTIAEVPRDAFWTWGLYDSWVVVIPSLDIVAVRVGRSLPRKPGGHHYDVLRPFLIPLARSAGYKPSATDPQPVTASSAHALLLPPSSFIRRISWDDPDEIISMAFGSDNWPNTWYKDVLITAYGDGWGFQPHVPEKLSLGLAVVRGDPPKVTGRNIRAPTVEQYGSGSKGKKASGLLAVGDRLYMLVRNAQLAQITYSDDGGRTWHWSDWRFTAGFACPTFLNFGPNYANAFDDFVYIYSPDSNSAYEPADRVILARVPKDCVLKQEAYEYFVRIDEQGRAVWTRDISRRGAVLINPGKCGRMSACYAAPVKRFLIVQVMPASQKGANRGLAIYDAPTPWGPWSVVFWADSWDVDPGESASIPTKWIATDGAEAWLLFSGQDSFSLRRMYWHK